MEQLTNKRNEKPQYKSTVPDVQPGLVASRQAQLIASLSNSNNYNKNKENNNRSGNNFTASKTGPLWTAPPSLREWDQSTVM